MQYFSLKCHSCTCLHGCAAIFHIARIFKRLSCPAAFVFSISGGKISRSLAPSLYLPPNSSWDVPSGF